jgi:hypothetical protein
MPAGAAGEQAAEEVLEAAVRCAARAVRCKARAAAHGPDGVILLPLIRIGQHGVRLGDVLELLLRSSFPGVRIRVVLPRELPVSLLDVSVGSVLGNTKDLIEVLVHPVLASQWRFLSKICAEMTVRGNGFRTLPPRTVISFGVMA